jgi:hypothetical protein
MLHYVHENRDIECAFDLVKGPTFDRSPELTSCSDRDRIEVYSTGVEPRVGGRLNEVSNMAADVEESSAPRSTGDLANNARAPFVPG